MRILKAGAFAWLPWAVSWFFGGAVAYGGWSLTVWARAYCDAGYEAGGRFELNLLLPLSTVGGGLAGLMALAVGRLLVLRAPPGVRVCVPALLVVSVPVLLAWWLFATTGTLDGYPGDSGLCPASNIPPQWPGSIPA
ncbi:hypothetical protein [Streptomyces canus]|uniref:hypothetical protein n=1 Tax=Streptomyces canus TaxID=58343 RepID=UPI0033B5769B